MTQFERFLAKILQQRDTIWPVEIPMAQVEVCDPLMIQVCWQGDSVPHAVRLDPLATIQQLIGAECALSQCAEEVAAFDCEGRRLDAQSLVAFHKSVTLVPLSMLSTGAVLSDVLACPCADWSDKEENPTTPTVPFDVEEM